MSSNRKAVQQAHEHAVLAAAVAEHNRITGGALKVTQRPDPPDAILSDGVTTTWMELTDAFFSPEWAKDIVGFAADQVHRPMEAGLYMDMDAQLARAFCDIVRQKAAKTSYQAFINCYGPGVLVVGLESPWLDEEIVEEIDREWREQGSPDVSQTFSHIYLGFRDSNGNFARLWKKY
ncbi:hypothetical protein IB256_27775 [Pseudomonas sp. PDM17]|uniref:hypothetical protein n=1 Tax=Pseudomonas sp. PDM17 TaxID=2769285 RepID=UPI00177ECA76|nr:hypothetical protein [Pseudomonas sp. PDM17]MBD9504608.1 hypothetical protein [Pseudomonas sp. PDM17]